MPTSDEDQKWMGIALQEAEKALGTNDVPIGAIAVHKGEIIGRGCNRREGDQDPTAHAEMIALRQAADVLGQWRLEDVTFYCTLEPCAMCAGALVLARVPRLVYAAIDPKAGAAGSIMDLTRHHRLNHQLQVDHGVLAEEAAGLIREFFRNLRAQGEK